MSKKGLISSLIISVVVTLALGIYTLVSVFGGNPSAPAGPQNTIVSVAFRTGDTTDLFSGYADEKIHLNTQPGQNSPIQLNVETGKYDAVSAGEVSVVIDLDDKGNTLTYEVEVFAHGDGSSEDSAYVIANAAHLKEFADNVNNLSAERSVPMFTKLVADIDLGEYNWRPIGGQGNTAYVGTFDGNGKTIKNLKINVNAENYQDFITISTNSTETKAFLDLGLFGRIEHATIKNLNIKDANINLHSDVYAIANQPSGPDGVAWEKMARVTIGTIAGAAYDSDIIGSEEGSSVVARINGFSCNQTGSAHGIGGVIGGAQLARVKNYNIQTNVINNKPETKGSWIGGAIGYSASLYANTDTTIVPSVDQRGLVENVKVDLTATVLYKNEAIVGGLVGIGYNIGILDSEVSSFKITDTTALGNIKIDELEQNPDNSYKLTRVAGIIYDMRKVDVSADYAHYETVNAFVSEIKNVNVSNIDVYMPGGEAAGAVYILGGRRVADADVTENTTVTDVTVSGSITADRVAGFAFEVNPGTKVLYTKVFADPVVKLNISAAISAGFVYFNFGEVAGFETEDGVKTRIEINTIGRGAKLIDLSPESYYNFINTTNASGFVIETYKHALKAATPSISKFDIRFTASKSVNYAGVAVEIGDAIISDIDVTANFTSYNYHVQDKNYSTTYRVAGVACEASAGAVIERVNVIVNANKDVDKTLKYGTSIFGGIVARYLGSSESAGLTIKDCSVGGDVYFNYTYQTLLIDELKYDVFMMGGLIGAMQSFSGSIDGIADGLQEININNIVITNNTIENLKMTADLVQEPTGKDGWRAKGIGSMIGTLFESRTTTDKIDLSSNTLSNVEIVADTETFQFEISLSSGTIVRTSIGATDRVYGTSYKSHNQGLTGNSLVVVNPADLTGVTFTPLAA